MKIRLATLTLLAIFIGFFGIQTNAFSKPAATFNNSKVQRMPGLTAVEFGDRTGHQTEINFTFDKKLEEKPLSFTTTDPARIIVDFANTHNALKKSHLAIDSGAVRDVRVLEANGRTRAVIDLKEATSYKTVMKGKTARLLLASASLQPKYPKEDHFRSKSSRFFKQPQRIKHIDFQKTAKESGKLIVALNSKDVNIDLREEGGIYIAEFKDTQLPKRLQQRYDVRDFGTPIQTIDVTQQGDKVRMEINAKGQYEHLAYQVNSNFIMDVKPIEKEHKGLEKRRKPDYKGSRLSLNFQDIKVRNVLQLLAEFTKINIVVSDSVQGSMTLRLHDVPWDQALDIILKTQGLDKRRMGNVVLVAPAKELAAQEKAELVAQQDVTNLAPLHSELIQINYAKAENLADLLKKKSSSILSSRGNVSFDERTNFLVVQDTASRLREVRHFLGKLDVPVKQVLIEARIVNVDKDFEKDLGIRFGLTKENHYSGTLSAANKLASGEEPSAIFNELAKTTDRLNVDLPASVSSIGEKAGTLGIALAKLGHDILLDLELSAIESEGRGKVLSAPRLMTANQHEAYIEKGEEIPYEAATSSGATAVEFKKAVLSLRVTPQITPDNRIILNLQVNQDKKSDTTSVDGVPAIDTREISTQVLVDNGQTIVLGGIYEKTDTKTVKRVPFFGSLPIIGALFRNSQKIDKRKELLVFVTPKIVDSNIS